MNYNDLVGMIVHKKQAENDTKVNEVFDLLVRLIAVLLEQRAITTSDLEQLVSNNDSFNLSHVRPKCDAFNEHKKTEETMEFVKQVLKDQGKQK